MFMGVFHSEGEPTYSLETKLVAYNPCEKDPYGAASMPIYQTSTFAQVIGHM
jgi:cystathionine beta-lyase